MIENRKARYEYEILDTYTAGIVLVGNEVKSVRSGNASIVESYCVFDNNELFIIGSYIEPYKFAFGMSVNEPRRNRKLLLTKHELRKIQNTVKDKGITVIPLKMYFNDKNRLKVDIGICRGKKLYDKRESIKKRDIERDLKNY